ncbi:hypothetical protein [Vibrio owensii]|uniref:hypothetical protein n=1 Tax=Vibrio owensii TaxID=696485 RepID=UPI0038CED3FA
MSGSDSPEVVDSELDKELANISKERWEHYNEVIVPAENRWIEDMASQNQEKYYEEAAGQGNVATQRAMGLNQTAMLEQGGNTSRMSANIANNAITEQAMNTDIQSRMQADQSKRYLGGLQNVIAVGQGKETHAIETGANAANYANQYAMDEAKNAANDSSGAAIGMGIGAGTRYGMG